jgi:hypothetical protein
MRPILRQTFFVVAVVRMTSGVSRAQSSETPTPSEAGSGPLASLVTDALFAQQPAGPPPTPRHTGIKAMTKHLVTNFTYLPSMENLYWAGAGAGSRSPRIRSTTT